MKRKTVILGVVLIWGAFSFASAAEKCDRACLVGLMDQYLAAVVKHNPAGVPIASDVKLVENLKPIPSARDYGKPPPAARLNLKFMSPIPLQDKSDLWELCRTRANRYFWAPA